MEKIIAAFEKQSNALHIREILENEGLGSVLICASGAEVRRVLVFEPVRLVVCGFKLPDGACAYLRDDLSPGCAMLMLAARHHLDLCGREDIFKLAAPAGRSDLTASVRMLLTPRPRPAPRTVRSAEEQAAIRRAKELLMDRNGMTEAQAHRFLQKQSMDNGDTLTETARRLLEDT